jgi:hypothetical protein
MEVAEGAARLIAALPATAGTRPEHAVTFGVTHQVPLPQAMRDGSALQLGRR